MRQKVSNMVDRMVSDTMQHIFERAIRLAPLHLEGGYYLMIEKKFEHF
jgi:hypothetical protein